MGCVPVAAVRAGRLPQQMKLFRHLKQAHLCQWSAGDMCPTEVAPATGGGVPRHLGQAYLCTHWVGTLAVAANGAGCLPQHMGSQTSATGVSLPANTMWLPGRLKAQAELNEQILLLHMMSHTPPIPSCCLQKHRICWVL